MAFLLNSPVTPFVVLLAYFIGAVIFLALMDTSYFVWAFILYKKCGFSPRVARLFAMSSFGLKYLKKICPADEETCKSCVCRNWTCPNYGGGKLEK